ncbi:uncharacterized protein ASCRUDRAFT_77628 [Ascoidea rubescens DSM 1968]|uniref:Uncharacterized protein n=1 Tax=Ascoidea rubescens DSM 1968 TaxID=1344418 RepID=A0A1D2VBQ7_9ASCO|nr:hypothetical protein ASCRUDRAFT_77628 [Ascoidea rubescens DSM 1968]ODV58913.1 hypothetical protein ASCRUDRAFT_77628 [Ascoidea rubescens DSM 1968]
MCQPQYESIPFGSIRYLTFWECCNEHQEVLVTEESIEDTYFDIICTQCNHRFCQYCEINEIVKQTNNGIDLYEFLAMSEQ